MGMYLHAAYGLGVVVEDPCWDDLDWADANSRLRVRGTGTYDDGSPAVVYVASSLHSAQDGWPTKVYPGYDVADDDLDALHEFCDRYDVSYKPRWYLSAFYG